MANTMMSRKDNGASRRNAETARIRMPAARNRAASRISGGQSVTPILPATKAKLQSRQNSVMVSGSVLKRLRGIESEGASDMGASPSPTDLGLRVGIWKLNDKLQFSD